MKAFSEFIYRVVIILVFTAVVAIGTYHPHHQPFYNKIKKVAQNWK